MRYASIQTLRALAILTVVLGHLALVEVKFGQGATVLPAFLIRGLGGIDLFFIISGLMMVITSRGKFHSGKRALSFIYNRLVRIYPLYWIYSFAALAAFLIHPAWWVTNAPENWRDLLVSFLLLPSRRLPLLNVAWMLIHLIYFYDYLCPFSLAIEGGTAAGRPNPLGFAGAGRSSLFSFRQQPQPHS